MAQPSITSISFDQDSYEPGDTITATVVYSSPNEHGGEGVAQYSFGVALSDQLTGATNSGLSDQSASFYVSTGSEAPNPVDLLVTASLVSPGLSVSSLGSGAIASSNDAANGSVTVSAEANSLLVAWLMGGTISGLGLTWTEAASAGSLSVYTALVPDGGVAGSLTVSGSYWASWDVDLVTGVDPAAPIVSTNIQTSSITLPAEDPGASLAMNAAQNAANLFLFGSGISNGWWSYSGSPSESPTAWTQLASVQSANTADDPAVPVNALETQVSPSAAETTASVSWSTGGYQPGCGSIGLELQAFQSGVAGLPPGPWTMIFNNLDGDGTGTAVFQAVA